MSDINPLLTQRPTINPYRYGAFEIWNRLKWDLNPESWRSRRIIKSWKNRYDGQKAVIVCNGLRVKWQLPDITQSEIYYTLGNEVYITVGRSIVNATEGGCLEIFPRISLDEFIHA